VVWVVSLGEEDGETEGVSANDIGLLGHGDAETVRDGLARQSSILRDAFRAGCFFVWKCLASVLAPFLAKRHASRPTPRVRLGQREDETHWQPPRSL
jgi:hypothetical protein